LCACVPLFPTIQTPHTTTMDSGGRPKTSRGVANPSPEQFASYVVPSPYQDTGSYTLRLDRNNDNHNQNGNRGSRNNNYFNDYIIEEGTSHSDSDDADDEHTPVYNTSEIRRAKPATSTAASASSSSSNVNNSKINSSRNNNNNNSYNSNVNNELKLRLSATSSSSSSSSSTSTSTSSSSKSPSKSPSKSRVAVALGCWLFGSGLHVLNGNEHYCFFGKV
jgi:hypothetical protein